MAVAQQDKALGWRRNQRFIVGAAVCVIVSALAAFAVDVVRLNGVIQNGAFAVVPDASGDVVAGVVGERARELILTSILTAIVEELVFRGVLLRALLRKLSARAVIVATSAIFAVLHMLPFGMPEAVGDWAALAATSLLLKGLQAFLFGSVMAAIVLRGGNLPIVMALHALFDTLCFAVPVLSTGAFPDTYIATAPEQLIPVALSALLLAPAAVSALWREFA